MLHGMIVAGKNTGFCYVIAFFINGFSISAFRTITNKSKCLEPAAFRFYHITIIDMDNGIAGNHCTNKGQI